LKKISISEGYSISVTITKTLNSNFTEKNSSLNFQTKFKFNFNEHILNNEIFLYQTSDDSFKITILLENQDLKQITFQTHTLPNPTISSIPLNTDNLPKFLVHEGTLPFEKSAKLTCCDHIFFDYNTKSDYFACGLISGNINIFQVSNDFNNMLKLANLREIRYDIDYSQPAQSSPFSLNLKQKFTQFFAAKPQPSAVKSVKYLKDHMICYITEDGKFKIFNQLLNKEVYCNEKIIFGLNNEDEKIIKCKIEYLDYDASKNFFLGTSSKILFFCVYVELANLQFLNIFELQFLDIPLNNEIAATNNNNAFALSDYGNNVRFNNNKLVRLSGKLIDLKTINDKFWSVSRKSALHEVDERSEKALFDKYEFKIFNTFKLQNESEREEENTDYNYNNNNFNTNINGKNNFLNLEESFNNNNSNDSVINKKYNSESEAKDAFFNHSNQEVILIDDKLKNFALTIKQMSLIKNENSRNRSLFRLLLGAECIISNEQLMVFNRKITETNASQMLANHSTTQNRNFLRECETQKELVNRAAILKRIFSENFNSEILLNFIQNLIFESFENKIISLGIIKNKNLDSVCVIRESGIGFLRFVSEFQKVNEIVGSHEVHMRSLIFCRKSFEKLSSQSVFMVNKETKLLQSKILSYVSAQSQISEENALFVCFALLRILLADNFINLADYNFFVDFFNSEDNSENNFCGYINNSNNLSSNSNNKNLKDFIDELFGEKLQKENKLLFLDAFNSVISKILLSNVNLLLKKFKDLESKFAEYQNSDLAMKISKFAKEENSNFGFGNRNSNELSPAASKFDFKFNYKFCEIIKKITQDKIEALFFLSRDLVAFAKWVETYHYNLLSAKVDDKLDFLGNTLIICLFFKNFKFSLFFLSRISNLN
jgi:hypothetical protein